MTRYYIWNETLGGWHIGKDSITTHFGRAMSYSYEDNARKVLSELTDTCFLMERKEP